MLSIRFTRVGKKKKPIYRIVVMDKRRDPWAKFIEILGSRNPHTKETTLKEDRIKYWLGQGAKATNTVWNLLVDEKVVEDKKLGSSHISKKRKTKQEAKDVEAKEKAEAAKEKADAAKEAAPEAEAATPSPEEPAETAPAADAEVAAPEETKSPATEAAPKKAETAPEAPTETTETPEEKPAK